MTHSSGPRLGGFPRGLPARRLRRIPWRPRPVGMAHVSDHLLRGIGLRRDHFADLDPSPGATRLTSQKETTHETHHPHRRLRRRARLHRPHRRGRADGARALQTKGAQALRHEGLAFLELDPEAPDYGRILARIDLPPDMIGHHIFYNPARDRAYVTSLGRPELWVFDVTEFPYRPKVVPVPDCDVLEDVTFSEALDRWYLSCMGSSNVVVGDAETDEPLRTIALPEPYPHGITVHDGIDRILLTSTSNPADFSDAGETITVLRASTEEVLSTHKVSNKPSPSRAEPVEIFFVPGAEPPLAYVTKATKGRSGSANGSPGRRSSRSPRYSTSARWSRAWRSRSTSTPRATAPT